HQVPDVVVASTDEVADEPAVVLRRQADARWLRELEDEHRQRPRGRERAPLDRDDRGQIAIAEPPQAQASPLTPRGLLDLAQSISLHRAVSDKGVESGPAAPRLPPPQPRKRAW